jgi:AraC-like DNA-binding protein
VPGPRDSVAEVRTVPAGYVAAAVRAADRHGLDATPALAAAGIPRSLLGDPRARFTAAQTADLTRALWLLFDDEMFGLGRAPVPRGTFRLLSYAVIHAPDLRSVYERVIGFGPALAGIPPFSIQCAGGHARLAADVHGVRDPGHLVTDFLLVLTHRFSGWLVGQRLRLVAVELPRPAAGDRVEYDRMFGAPLRFDAPAAALVFEDRLLSLPIVRSEADLDEYLRHSPADALARRDYGTTLADQVRTILERARPTTSTEIAARLSISPQHLRRRLRDEGTSLGAIRAELQRDAAITALARGDAVDAVSARLGFSEPSAFRRAFKRWTGSTPAAYQAR